jgi:hypothetical protein
MKKDYILEDFKMLERRFKLNNIDIEISLQYKKDYEYCFKGKILTKAIVDNNFDCKFRINKQDRHKIEMSYRYRYRDGKFPIDLWVVAKCRLYDMIWKHLFGKMELYY